MTTETTIFNAHCQCCDKPAKVFYTGETFNRIECGCAIRIAIRTEEHNEFVRRIREAIDDGLTSNA